MKTLIMKSPPVLCYFVPLSSKFLPHNPILKHPWPMFFPQSDRLRKHSYKTTGKIIVLQFLIHYHAMMIHYEKYDQQVHKRICKFTV